MTMAYNPISQLSPVDSAFNYSHSPVEDDHEHDLDSPALFLATSNYDGMQDSVASRSTRATYDMLDDHDSQPSPVKANSIDNELHVVRKRDHEQFGNPQNSTIQEPQPMQSVTPEQAATSMRTASLRSFSVPLRHPTPDVSVPGSMVGNVEQLERTAERLSMTSDIGLEIQKMHLDQKRSDSRRSSLLTSPELPPINKQFSSNSIVEINNAARSGGYSPGGFMISPRNSMSNRGRSASKGSRYSSRPEPEQEGRPLDSFVNSLPTLSPVDSRASSFAEGAEMSTMARALAGADVTNNPMSSESQKAYANHQPEDSERPATSASQTTIEQAQKMFQDFDGVHSHHFVSRSRATSGSAIGIAEDNLGPDFSQGLKMPGTLPRPEVEIRNTSGIDERISSAPPATRPQSYADPKTGQQYVYYPAPVPATLNLPPKLSSKSTIAARDKRRSQALSNVPEGVRENDVDSSKNGNTSEHSPQDQRPVTGGRRLTQDQINVPPQVRAIAFFNHPSIEKRIPQRNSKIELKGQSATATLDNILDASATAPVDAFANHAVAGSVSGQPKSPTEEEKKERRRSSFGQWLARKSGLEYDFNTITTDLSTLDIQKAREKEKEKEKRRSMMAMSDSGKLQTDGHEEGENEATPLHAVIGADRGDEEGQFMGEEYTGPPTTLLAELQLRKQQAKQRTRPITSMYPNGVRSTLLELDTVAEMEKKAREKKRITLAWEESNANGQADDDDDDIPLGILYPGQVVSQPRNRPISLLAHREMEDSEPLSHRRDRLRPATQSRRASSMLDMPLPGEDPSKRESFLASSRPVSGDFASELMSQFGGDLLGDETAQSKDKGKGKAVDNGDAGPVPEEEETLAQRKKRLRAERQAREAEVGPGLGLRSATVQEQRPQLRQRRSMADILSVHPAGRTSPGPQLVTRRSSSYSLGGGLLGLHDQEAKRRSSALSIDMIKAAPKPPGTQRQPNRASSMTMAGMGSGMGMGMMGATPYGAAPGYQNLAAMQSMPQFYSPTMALGFQGAGYGQGMNQMNLMQQQQQYMMAGYGSYQPNYGYGAQIPYQGMGMMPVGYNGQMSIGIGGYPQPMSGMQQMPLSQAQLDMVERWRQSIAQ